MNRFEGAQIHIFTGDYSVESKGKDAWYLKVGEYDVKIADNGCTCTCPYGSMWGHGGSKSLPCRHILTAFGVRVGLAGAPLKERWTDMRLKIIDMYNELNDVQKKQVRNYINNDKL